MPRMTPEGFLKELLDIRDKLKLFVSLIAEGQPTYYKDISLKLRILYCQKSGTAPLLKIIEDQFGLDIFVAIRHSMREKVERGLLPASLAEGLVFEQINSVVTWFEGGDEVASVFDALDREEVLHGSQRYTYKQIIEAAADKMGGAHVDLKVPQRDLALHAEDLLIGGLPVAQRALYDTARATIALIEAIEGFLTKGEERPFLRKRASQAG